MNSGKESAVKSREDVIPNEDQKDILPLPDLLISRYRFVLRLLAEGTEPEHLATVLRGGLNWHTKQLVCMQPQLERCDDCLLLHVCTYPALFAPVPPSDTEVLRTHSRVPPPYVISTDDDSDTVWKKGARVVFDVVLAGRAASYLPHLILAAQRLAKEGLGRARVRAELQRVESHPVAGQKPGTELWVDEHLRPDWARFGQVNHADLHTAEKMDRVTLRFQTATRLKYQDKFIEESPAFHILVRTLLRRLSSLTYFFGNNRWDIDYAGWIERAKEVEIAEADVRWQEWGRYSSRQKRHMNLGGLKGEVVYGGDVTPFLPLLRLGRLIHVGKGAVFGNGRYEIVNGER